MNMSETGMKLPCCVQILYREVLDGGDFAMVVVAAIETGENDLGRIYVMNSLAATAGQQPIRDRMEVVQARSDAEAQRIGIGLFDSLVRELSEPASLPETGHDALIDIAERHMDQASLAGIPAIAPDIDVLVRRVAKSGTPDTARINWCAQWDGSEIRATFGAGTNSASVVNAYGETLYEADAFGSYVRVFRPGPWVERLRSWIESHEKAQAAPPRSRVGGVVSATATVDSDRTRGAVRPLPSAHTPAL